MPAPSPSSSDPLIDLRGVWREYPSGEGNIAALKGIDLAIRAGEIVAIVGASGSGKSTLMNILGCLDRPTRGSYRIGGHETSALEPDQLAALRRGHFGFIFQGYHLLSDLSALGNVEVPAVYAGTSRPARQERAKQLLARLGIGDRATHKPGQLSGGQQQRVSIARALMNGGHVILADEPTGALDSHSGEEVLKVLKELHADGHTVIIVTHDMKVAEHADRIIELRDGEVLSDRQLRNRSGGDAAPGGTQELRDAFRWGAVLDRFLEAARMSLLAMNAHRLRTFLTMLGIIIGIASVVSVVALGQGSQQRILKDISSMGTNTIDVYPGSGFGDMRAARVQTLRPDDAAALAEQSYVDSVTPSVSTSETLRYRDIAVSGQVYGVGDKYFRVRGLSFAQGQAFDAGETRRIAQVVVIDDNTRKALFPHGGALGAVILVGKVPCRVVGVTEKQTSGFGNNDNPSVWLPYTTAMARLLGQHYLSSITVRVKDSASMSAAQDGITRLLKLRHGRGDFYVYNTDTIRQTIQKTTATMTLLVAMIAVISLIVGGIGVMNIMLVSVTERTAEIGVRMAVGARQSDIMQQFLIEAVLVCLAGGLVGVILAVAIGVVFAHSGAGFTMVYSATSMVSAFVCSTLIGVVFGFLPARNAARLDPVDALARE